MEFTIEAMKECHRETILAMMRTFYASPAVLSNGSEEIFAADIDADDMVAAVAGAPLADVGAIAHHGFDAVQAQLGKLHGTHLPLLRLYRIARRLSRKISVLYKNFSKNHFRKSAAVLQ